MKQNLQRLVCLALMFLLSWPSGSGAAPTAGEKRAFDAAVRAFADGFYERAEHELADFVAKNPQSELVAQAVLLQAQSKSRLKDHKGAVALLGSRLDASGPLRDQYQFWLAQAQFELGELKLAAAGFASLVAEFPRSSRVLEASYREALARFKLGESAAAVQSLGDPKGVFAQAAKLQPASEPAVRGTLLLAEALLQQKQYPAMLKALEPLAGKSLTPELAWLRQYWLVRAQFESGDAELALASVNALGPLASVSGSREHAAETFALQGTILQRMNQFEAATKSFERNLADGVAPERRRQALVKIIEISLGQDQPTNTVQWLERFIKERPADASLDVVRLTLGELKLKQYFALPEESTATVRSNLLADTRTQLDQFLTDFPRSSLAGKVQLYRGLVFWEDGQMPEARVVLEKAVAQMPPGEEQAIARFKLADVQFQQKDFRSALSNYQAVISAYAKVPTVREGLFGQALYQIVRASIELGDIDKSSDAVAKILAQYPDGLFGDRSLLLLGQALNRRGQPDRARAMFVEFLRRFPDSKLASEVHLAIARTYVQDQNWTSGLGKLDDWIAANPEHPSRPQAEFDRAWLTARAGDATNSLARFTNFVGRFPADALAPKAQNWIADYYWNAGDFRNAEKNYQLLFQNTNWPVSELSYDARLMAGRAALARQGYREAKEYFAEVFSDEKAPSGAALRALLFWGDVVKEEPAVESAKTLEKFGEAINAFRRIITRAPNDPLVPAAFGSIANCHFQLATQEPKRYEDALENYRHVIEHPAADVSLRSQAGVAMGMVYERQAQSKTGPEQAPLLKLALGEYLNVLYGSNLKDGEVADAYWVKDAGSKALALLESQQRWTEAAQICSELIKQFPPLRPTLEKKLKMLRDKSGESGN